MDAISRRERGEKAPLPSPSTMMRKRGTRLSFNLGSVKEKGSDLVFGFEMAQRGGRERGADSAICKEGKARLDLLFVRKSSSTLIIQVERRKGGGGLASTPPPSGMKRKKKRNSVSCVASIWDGRKGERSTRTTRSRRIRG